MRSSSLRRLEWVGLIGVPALAAAYVALLAVARWPAYWAWIAPEQTPMTWLQSIMLVVCALAALLLAAGNRLRGQGCAPWVVLAAGFAFLALDERFALHERVRDGYLAPRGVALPFLPWVAPGDFLLLGYAIVGLAVLPLALRAFRGNRRALRLLLAGAAFALVAVVADSLDVQSMSLTMEVREQTGEELVELASSTCFLLAMWLQLLPRLAPDGVADRAAAKPPPVPEPPIEASAQDGSRGRSVGGHRRPVRNPSRQLE